MVSRHDPLNKPKDPFNAITEQQWSGVLHTIRIGQQSTNKIHYRQRFTGDANTEITNQ